MFGIYVVTKCNDEILYIDNYPLQTEQVNDDTESVVVEASAPVYQYSSDGAVTGVNSAAGHGEASVNSAAAAPPVFDPNRDSFLDWISAFLKPNQPSPVLPIGDPPEDCPPCGQ